MSSSAGSDPIDYQAWQARRDELQQRVLTSPGYEVYFNLQGFHRAFVSWNDEWIELLDLLTSYENDPHIILALNNVNRPDETDQLVRALDRKTLSCMASLKSIIDFPRSGLNKSASENLGAEFDSRKDALNEEHLVVPFMIGFRNYVQHKKAAPWQTTFHFAPGTFKGTIQLNATTLRRSGAFKSRAKQFLLEHEPSLDFRPAAEEFGKRETELMLWYYDAIGKEGEPLMAETERLRQKFIDREGAYRTTEDRPTID